MRYFRNYISKFFAFLIALQILNMSIDAPAAMLPDNMANSDFNYIDTFVEYVAEVVLKFDNAIPESKDRQQKELQLHKQLEVVSFLKVSNTLQAPFCEIEIRSYRHSDDKYAYQFVKEINPPPPKAA